MFRVELLDSIGHAEPYITIFDNLDDARALIDIDRVETLAEKVEGCGARIIEITEREVYAVSYDE